MRSSQHRVPCRTVDASLGHRPRGPGGGGGGFIFRHSSTGRFGRPDGGAKMVERAISRITAARIHQRRLCMQRLRVTPADSLYCGVAILAVEGGQWWNKAMDGLFHTYTLHRRKRCPSAVGILGIRTGRPTGGTRPWMACSTHIHCIAGSDARRPWESLAFAPADPLVEQGHGWLVPHIYRQQPPQAGWEPPAGALLHRRIH